MSSLQVVVLFLPVVPGGMWGYSEVAALSVCLSKPLAWTNYSIHHSYRCNWFSYHSGLCWYDSQLENIQDWKVLHWAGRYLSNCSGYWLSSLLWPFITCASRNYFQSAFFINNGSLCLLRLRIVSFVNSCHKLKNQFIMLVFNKLP